tara:strand:- start:362 stop:1096 length:735 start_codon:yes stop_codon:yes gene_type:complete
MERTMLIDGDMLAFRASAASEDPIKWNDDYWTLFSDPDKAKGIFQNHVEELMNHVECDDVHLAFSSSKCFRHDINPQYKANRKNKRKPMALAEVVQWCRKKWTSFVWDNLEADDVIGIMATRKDTNYMVVSGDKDFRTIPCEQYDFIRGQFFDISEEEATFNFLKQALAGDTTDGYNGLKGYGPKTATKLLDKQGATWETVRDAYIQKGSTEEEALLNARMAYILQSKNYNLKTQKVTLWEPNS